MEESKLISLISEIMSLNNSRDPMDFESKMVSLINQIISLIGSMDSDSLPKPESELISLVTRIISLVGSLDLDSQPKPLSELVSLTRQKISLVNSVDLDSEPKSEFISLIAQALDLEPAPEIISLLHRIFSVVISMNSKWNKLISLSPRVEVKLLEEGKFHVIEEIPWRSNGKWACLPFNWMEFRLTREGGATHFFCRGCNGGNHEEHEKAPVEIKHPLHPKHSLQLVLFDDDEEEYRTRNCYCCDEDLIGVFYYCSACDFAMDIACVKKPPILAIDHPKWHEHTLALFPRQDFLTCNVCALSHSRSPIYVCLPCGFVVHQTCIRLPRVVRISRHLHRISFIPSFDQGDWSCGICRRKIDNRYGGYSCIKDGCTYAAHSRCATQSNVWDSIDLEGVPEETEEEDGEELETCIRLPRVIRISRHPHRISFTSSFDQGDWSCRICRRKIDNDYGGYTCMKDDCSYAAHSTCATQSNIWDGAEVEGVPEEETEEEDGEELEEEELIEPFVSISDGIIQHFSHERHHLRLDENSLRDYDDSKECQACNLPIFFGNFYSCLQCDFVLHETCANFSRKVYHPTHPHVLTLKVKVEHDGVLNTRKLCSVCPWLCTGFFYQCDAEGCDFYKLHVRCATTPEPLMHETHPHPLFLTSRPGEQRTCGVCKNSRSAHKETFNCVEEYCDFSLCFSCATLPLLVRYTDDTHVLTLSYGVNETMTYWCEICERKLDPKGPFYRCDEYCTVTLHIDCLLGNFR